MTTPSRDDAGTADGELGRPGALRAVCERSAAARQDGADVAARSKARLAVPVMVAGGERGSRDWTVPGWGARAADVGSDVVPHAGHWLFDEKPADTVGLLDEHLHAADDRAAA